ncbi:MAG TPA: TlpA disulfide reductase family protein [Candidatus Eisenbacteria bacterium]|jgi:thiol-disulfide isomerase/thioredoxin
MRTRPTTVLFALLTVGACHAATCFGEPRLAPPFSVKGLDGRIIRLSDFRGRPVVVDFWATWCGPCRASMPHLDALQRRYDPRGLVVIGLSVDEGSAQGVRQFAARMGVGFRLAMADEGLLDRYGPIRYLPTTFFISRTGEIVRRVRGYIDPETMEAYIQELF